MPILIQEQSLKNVIGPLADMDIDDTKKTILYQLLVQVGGKERENMIELLKDDSMRELILDNVEKKKQAFAKGDPMALEQIISDEQKVVEEMG